MKYFVNGQCIVCSLCSDICPEVFSMTSEGVAKAIEAEKERLVPNCFSCVSCCGRTIAYRVTDR